MRPPPWLPPVELSASEAQLVHRLKRKSRFFVFLRAHRHELLTAEFQAEIATLYRASAKGQPPIPRGWLALATLVRAYTGLSDEDVIDATRMDRRISIDDAEQRHGRKSQAVRFDGYKQNVVRDLAQAGIIRAVGVTPANRPRAEVAPAVLDDLARQHLDIAEWHVDRAYLSSRVVTDRAPEAVIWCKPYLVRNKTQFPKTAFGFDAERPQLTWPAGVTQTGRAGQTVQFPAERCDPCALRAQCIPARPGIGRSVALHPEEVRLGDLRAAQATPEGQAKFRERVGVEHSLARLGQVCGNVARHRGLRE